MNKSKHPYIDFSFKCGKDWSKMEGHEMGRHCSSCKKDLIDFSLMKNSEAVDFLKKNKANEVCGKMGSHQLMEVNTLASLQNQSSFSLKAILAGAALGISTITSAQDSLPVLHQNATLKVELVNSNFNADSLTENRIKGTVLGPTGEPVSYMKVILPEIHQACYTDFDGKFEFVYGDDFHGKIHLRSIDYGSDSSMNANDYANKEIQIVMSDFQVVGLEMVGVIIYDPTPAHWLNTKVRAFARFVRGRRE